jgi:ABC-type multidrug transport system fused ATPase/permease subunit
MPPGRMPPPAPPAPVTLKHLLTGGPLKMLAPRLKPHAGALVTATLMLLGSSTVSLLFPAVVGKLFDSAFGTADAALKATQKELNETAMAMAFLFTFQALMTFTQHYLLGVTGERVIAGLRKDLFAKLISLPPAFFSDRRTGELTSRLGADVQVMQGVLSMHASEMIRQLVLLTGAVTMLLVTQATLTLVTLCVVPVVVGTAMFFGKKLNKTSLQVMDQVADATATAEEAFSQIRVVQSFVGEPHERKRYGDRMDHAVAVATRRSITRGAFFSSLGFATFMASVLVIWLGGGMVLRGELGAGTLVSFLLYSGMVANSVGTVGGIWTAYMEATGAASRVFEILGSTPPLRAPENPKPLPTPVRGEVVFDDVWFRYEPPAELPSFLRLPPGAPPGMVMPPGAVPAAAPQDAKDAKADKPRKAPPPGAPLPPGMIRMPGTAKQDADGKPLAAEWTLRGIQLRLEPGETVALVGRSGSGKTTLASLISRFFDPQQGQITLDGIDVKDLRLADLRGAVGVVPQETLLFSGSIRDNIAYGKQDATEEEIVAAAKGAHAHEFIERLAEGYDTLVGERGIKISGGQRQRVALARAMLKDPAVLVLDEATSSLDAESEALIEDALSRMLGSRTTVIIAHRLSTVRRANRLLVLERGMIVEEGTHAELIARDGIYAALYARQFRDDVPEDEEAGEALAV